MWFCLALLILNFIQIYIISVLIKKLRITVALFRNSTSLSSISDFTLHLVGVTPNNVWKIYVSINFNITCIRPRIEKRTKAKKKKKKKGLKWLFRPGRIFWDAQLQNFRIKMNTCRPNDAEKLTNYHFFFIWTSLLSLDFLKSFKIIRPRVRFTRLWRRFIFWGRHKRLHWIDKNMK